MTRLGLMMVALSLGVAACSGAMAQIRGRGREAPRSSRDADLPPSVPPPVSTLAPTRGISGPRLEVGSVICNSEEDLLHRAEVNRRIADGVPDAGDPLGGCRMVNQQRGVEIVARHGPGRTEVKVKPGGEVGWTDAYLPN